MNRVNSFSEPAANLVRSAFAAAMLCALARAAPVTIVDNGPSANRVDIVFIGDGYTQADLDAGTYDQHIDSYLAHMFGASGFLADPFPRYAKFFNVHKLTVVSNESGADIPSESIVRDTALDATYDTFGINHVLTINNSDANLIRNQELAGTGITADMQFATVNHSKYGGWGGSWATFAGANSIAREIALHEIGHSFSDLVDEYSNQPTTYTGPEPPFRNVTKDSSGQKWSPWLGFDDPRGANLDIGAFQGAADYQFGLYRPSFNSKMRNLNVPFDAVSREAFIHDIYQFVDPLDDWLDNGPTVDDMDLWVEVVDPDVILLQWYVDDVLVPDATSDVFHARNYGYGPGNFDVRVRAYDAVLDYDFTGGLLDLVRSDFESLEQSVTWSLTINPSLPGDYNGDVVVDSNDYDLWRWTYGSQDLLTADGNDNGIVDAGDYVVWRKHLMSGGGAAAGTSIPEAATGSLAIVVLLIGGATYRARNWFESTCCVTSHAPARQV